MAVALLLVLSLAAARNLLSCVNGPGEQGFQSTGLEAKGLDSFQILLRGFGDWGRCVLYLWFVGWVGEVEIGD